MSGNLPPGFTEKVWEGWENYPCKRNPCNSILRKLANGRTLRVWRYDNPKVSWRVHLDSDWGDGETFSTEQAAADWANRYAAENGGWGMSGMTNWPQHFIDAGFTDAEIVPGVAYPRWRFYEGDFWLTSKPGCMVLEWQHSINHRMTIAIDPDGVVYTSYNKAAIWPMSLSLAHQAAEDLVCRLHGVPTAAEREVERLKFRVVEVENAIRVIGQQVSRTRTQFNIQDEPNDVEKQENKND